MEADVPDGARAQRIAALADAIYDLLHARAQSIGLLDISLEVNEWFIDIELMFATGADVGVSLDTRRGDCRCCELLGADGERWLDDAADLGPLLVDASPKGSFEDVARSVFDAVLAARRELSSR